MDLWERSHQGLSKDSSWYFAGPQPPAAAPSIAFASIAILLNPEVLWLSRDSRSCSSDIIFVCAY